MFATFEKGCINFCPVFPRYSFFSTWMFALGSVLKTASPLQKRLRSVSKTAIRILEAARSVLKTAVPILSDG